MDQSSSLNTHRSPECADLNATQTQADRGNADAQFALGLLYATTQGEGQDYPQAARWLLKAALQNHFMAQFNLGIMYKAGQGVPKDSAQAVMWFNKAAGQGDPGAQFHLGVFHQSASVGAMTADAIESRVEAYKWFHTAAAQDYLGAENACATLALTMTPEDVANGKRRAASLVPIKADYQKSPAIWPDEV